MKNDFITPTQPCNRMEGISMGSLPGINLPEPEKSEERSLPQRTMGLTQQGIRRHQSV